LRPFPHFSRFQEDLALANIASARKRARQAVKNRAHNMALRSRFRTSVKSVLKAIRTGDAEGATAAYRQAVPVIDSTVSKGLIHRNKAARHKSRLNARIREIGQA
jgi:small subunit ribosomal protein S20